MDAHARVDMGQKGALLSAVCSDDTGTLVERNAASKSRGLRTRIEIAVPSRRGGDGEKDDRRCHKRCQVTNGQEC